MTCLCTNQDHSNVDTMYGQKKFQWTTLFFINHKFLVKVWPLNISINLSLDGHQSDKFISINHLTRSFNVTVVHHSTSNWLVSVVAMESCVYLKCRSEFQWDQIKAWESWPRKWKTWCDPFDMRMALVLWIAHVMKVSNLYTWAFLYEHYPNHPMRRSQWDRYFNSIRPSSHPPPPMSSSLMILKCFIFHI